MPNTIISANNLGKRYFLNRDRQEKYATLREDLVQRTHKLRNTLFCSKKTSFQRQEEFWAIDNISFEVEQGDRVGIIGRNGAGKSTLLKILSRITEPSTGFVELRGRVASLLEVGTGFHPELTGRENIYLNGAILGMSKAEIACKFDEIVFFAEVEKFLDTPVKRYSSGMYVRLAFAVAAHLEPEILIVDEVLAVGDIKFQRKCLGKMKEAGAGGRTVIFVSHNMASISALCGKAICLQSGSVLAHGSCDSVISQYLESQDSLLPEASQLDLQNHPNRTYGSKTILRQAEIFCDGEKGVHLSMGGNLKITAHFQSDSEITHARFGISIESISGQRVINFSPSHQAPNLFPDCVTKGTITCEIPSLALLPGPYYITFIFANSMIDLDRINQAIQFFIEPSDVFGTGYAPSVEHGVFYAQASWLLHNQANKIISVH
jgi:lipopolysaccharide transport system ATP-binding protein